MLLFALLLAGGSAFAQVQSPLNIALAEVNTNHAEWGLTKDDVQNMHVSAITSDARTGISRVYLQQQYAGIKINQAVINVSIDAEGEVFFVGKRFVAELNTKINSGEPALDAEQAVQAALAHLQSPGVALTVIRENGSRQVTFAKDDFAKLDIETELQYQELKDGSVRLAWDMVIDLKTDNDRWSMRIDAMNGEVLAQQNWTIYCAHTNDAYHNHDAACREKPAGLGNVQEALTTQAAAVEMLAEDNAQYTVFALPLESPAHGDRSVVQNPAYLPASPFGWHDTDGVDGPEFTITRGNNTWAWEDRDDNQSSAGDEPDGGDDLIFDPPYDADAEPEEIIPAAVTNLFYMTNIMHDFAFANGMNTSEGAFQENNYGGGGIGGDPIDALAQAGADAGQEDNAFYSHANDGTSPSINMFVWGAGGGSQFLQVNEPASVGGAYDTGTADWGAQILPGEPGVTAGVTIVNDQIFNPYSTDACEAIQNVTELTGKIALIDRGGCEFGSKALAAEQAGAVGVIICNFEDATINMAAGADGNSVTIPVVSMKSIDCASIREFAGDDGLQATISAPVMTGPEKLDGDFDNGIIAHEFGHGISIRLTCGPNQGSLGNAEQMGEGWSDFMGLVLGTQEGDTGDMRRGVGTFVQRQPNDGRGIRRFPYSTDMNISPLTYGDVAGNTGVHAIGEVWCNMIWDLYWAFVEQDGWDPDVYEGTGGNNKAVRLVFEGMKNQACSPGFLDGRDAILAADMALYDGANQCLIWEVFARRGAGFFADQGSPNSATDQSEDFEPRPTCIQELKISKEVTPLVDAGDDIDVTVTVINHKPDPVDGVVVTDEIPEGTTYVAGSGSIAGTVNGNMVSFDLGTMAFEDEIVLTYKFATDPDIFSVTRFIDDMEGDVSNYFFNTFSDDDLENSFQLTDALSNSGNNSFFVSNPDEESQDALLNIDRLLIDGDQPVIRFYHNYDTEAGADAGLFQLTLDEDPLEGSVWQDAGADFFRGDYPAQVQYQTFVVPNLNAFSGDSDGWIASYADMSAFAGQEVYLRWMFGTNAGGAGFGWAIDDFEFMDMKNYVSDACVSSADGDEACATPAGRGTVVESQVVSSTFEPVTEDLSVSVFPNPAQDFIHVRMNTTTATEVNVTLHTVDGRTLQSYNVTASGETNLPVNVSALSDGFYFLQVTAEGQTYSEKVVIAK